MHSLRYLNTVLTIIAVLLTLQLWTQWTGGAGQAATPELTQTAHAAGIPNAAAQRAQMVDLLKKLNATADEQLKLLKGGEMRVQVRQGEAPEDAPGQAPARGR